MPEPVDLWIVPLERSGSDLERLHGHLSAEERERAGKRPLPPRKRRYVARQGALREILAGYAGCAPAEVSLVRSNRGKPALAGAGRLRFSVSDSGELALVAVAPREVGVDVEQMRKRRVTARASVSDFERFFQRWTRAEATGKALGTGLFVRGSNHRKVTCRSVSVAPGFAAAVAVAGGGFQVRLRPY